MVVNLSLILKFYLILVLILVLIIIQILVPILELDCYSTCCFVLNLFFIFGFVPILVPIRVVILLLTKHQISSIYSGSHYNYFRFDSSTNSIVCCCSDFGVESCSCSGSVIWFISGSGSHSGSYSNSDSIYGSELRFNSASDLGSRFDIDFEFSADSDSN